MSTETKEAKKVFGSTRELLLTPGGADNKHIMKSSQYFEHRPLNEDGQLIELKIMKGEAVITHDEHDKVVLTKGHYVKANQVEFDPFDNSVSYVFD
jgi:hypothetical protein